MEQVNDQMELRRHRRAGLYDHGINAYPSRVAFNITIHDLKAKWKLNKSVAIAGRIRAIRRQGGSAFIDLDDGTQTIQIFLQKKQLGDEFVHLSKQLDLGDFIRVSGQTFVTTAGEQSINVKSATWLAKTLRPLPSSWHGLEDVELRYRHRELDLLTNPTARTLFTQRATIIKSIREFLWQHDFIEVETPILQPLAGGASARPFITHHQALHTDLFLRIAPELYLKRLIVGGFRQVFEIARCFRNEGIDRDHNPEFTQVELYAAYRDYEWMMDFGSGECSATIP